MKNQNREYYKDGIKKRETRLGWMDACCHGDELCTLIINRHMRSIVTDYLVYMTRTLGNVPVDC